MSDRALFSWFEAAYQKKGRDAAGFRPLYERALRGDPDAELALELLIPAAWAEARKAKARLDGRKGGRPRKTQEALLIGYLVDIYRVAGGHTISRASTLVANELNKHLPKGERKITHAAVRDAYYKAVKRTSIADIFKLHLTEAAPNSPRLDAINTLLAEKKP